MTITVNATKPDDGVLVRRPGPQELRPVRTHRRRRALELGLAIAVPLLLVLLWQLAAERSWIDARVYPAPPPSWRTAGTGRAPASSGRTYGPRSSGSSAAMRSAPSRGTRSVC